MEVDNQEELQPDAAMKAVLEQVCLFLFLVTFSFVSQMSL
jgi:hypothetical protein